MCLNIYSEKWYKRDLLKVDTEVDDVTKLGKAFQSEITLGTNDE